MPNETESKLAANQAGESSTLAGAPQLAAETRLGALQLGDALAPDDEIEVTK